MPAWKPAATYKHCVAGSKDKKIWNSKEVASNRYYDPQNVPELMTEIGPKKIVAGAVYIASNMEERELLLFLVPSKRYWEDAYDGHTGVSVLQGIHLVF